MSQLYVLRHGIAVPHGTPGVADDDRPLTSKGQERVRQIARGLRSLGIELDRIVASPLPRAWQTAEIVADVLGMTDNLEAADALRAERDPASIREWLRTRDEPRLMIVGHNPAFSALPSLLVNGSADPALCELKRGGIAALSTRDAGGYTLDWLATPRILRRIDG